MFSWLESWRTRRALEAPQVVEAVVEGRPFHFRVLTGYERMGYFAKAEALLKAQPGEEGRFRVCLLMLALSLCDSAGRPVYAESDLDLIGAKVPSKLAVALALEGGRINGIGTDEKKA